MAVLHACMDSVFGCLRASHMQRRGGVSVASNRLKIASVDGSLQDLDIGVLGDMQRQPRRLLKHPKSLGLWAILLEHAGT